MTRKTRRDPVVKKQCTLCGQWYAKGGGITKHVESCKAVRALMAKAAKERETV
jgi:hypothetical protein